MRKSGILFIAALFTLELFHADAFAKDAPKRTAEDEKKITALHKRIETARTGLNGSSWEVNLKPMGPKEKAQKDTFTFQDTQFKSQYFIDNGYTATNYTVTMVGDDSERAIFETMLTSKDGVVFLRGEWEKENMSGQITEQLEGGKKIVERYFSTESRKAIPAESKIKDEGVKEPVSSALVSKESAPDVSPFAPGTTDESR